MKRSIALILGSCALVPAFAHAASGSSCDHREVIGNLEIIRRADRDGSCEFAIGHRNARSDYSRSYTFHGDGTLMVFYSFDPSGGEGRLSQTTGARQLIFLPRKSQLDYAVSADGRSVTVTVPSGSTLTFSTESATLQSAQGATVSEAATGTNENQGGLKIAPTDGSVILDQGFRRGELPEEPQRSVRFIDSHGTSCGAKNSELLEYLRDDSGGVDGARLKFRTNEELSKYLSKRCPKIRMEVKQEVAQTSQTSQVLQSNQASQTIPPIDPGSLSQVTQLDPAPVDVALPIDPVGSVVESVAAIDRDLATGTPSEGRCAELLEGYFGQSAGREKLREYLSIQGKIALHRMGWAFLKLNDGRTQGLEKTISELLKSRDPELHKRFDSAAQASAQQRLASAAGSLRQVLNERFGKEKSARPYLLDAADVQVLDLLATAEGASRGKIMSFARIIDASYRGRIPERERNLRVAEKTVQALEKKAAAIHREIAGYLAQNGCSASELIRHASRDPGCVIPDAGRPEVAQIEELLTGSGALRSLLLKGAGRNEKELNEAYGWNKFWLHVTK